MVAVRAAALALLGLAGCYTPPSAAGFERSVARYREGPRALLDRRGAPAEAPASLSVEQAVALAKEHSARLAELDARVAAADAAVDAAGQRANPQLRVTQLRLDQWLDGRPQARPMVRFRPERPGEIDARVAAARAAAAEARAEARAAAAALEAEVRWLFDDALLLGAEAAAAERGAAARRAIAARTAGRLGAGEALAIDEALASLASIDADQESSERRAQRGAALAALLDRLGLDPRAQVRLLGEALPPWPPPPLAPDPTLVEAALRNRLPLAAARVDGSDARVFLARSQRWPWFTSVDVGYQFAPGVPDGLGWAAQAAVEVPLFHANGGGVKAAEAAREAERRGLDAEAERVAREVRERRREVDAAGALVSELQQRARGALQRAEAEAARALAAQSIDALRALVIEERRAGVELRMLRLVRRYRAAAAGLRRAVGGPLPEAPPAPGEPGAGRDPLLAIV